MISLQTQAWAAPHPVELQRESHSELHSESSPRYFFWDIGSSGSKIDSGDIIIDVSKPCNSPQAQINLPGFIEGPIPRSVEPPAIEETQKVLKELSFPGIDDKFVQSARVFDYFHGKGSQLIVLLPEAHLVMQPQAVRRHRNLQINRSQLVEQMLEKAQLSGAPLILNLREGVEGSKIPEVSDVKEAQEDGSLGSSEIKFAQLAAAGYPSTFVGLNHVKSKRFSVYSAYLETLQLIGAEFLLGLGSYQSGKSFQNTVAEGELYYGEFPNKQELEKEYVKLQTMSEKRLDHLRKSICQSRGQQMVQRALDLAKKKKVHLIFLTYGSLHHHEITQVLKLQMKSYVTLIGLASI